MSMFCSVWSINDKRKRTYDGWALMESARTSRGEVSMADRQAQALHTSIQWGIGGLGL